MKRVKFLAFVLCIALVLSLTTMAADNIAVTTSATPTINSFVIEDYARYGALIGATGNLKRDRLQFAYDKIGDLTEPFWDKSAGTRLIAVEVRKMSEAPSGFGLVLKSDTLDTQGNDGHQWADLIFEKGANYDKYISLSFLIKTPQYFGSTSKNEKTNIKLAINAGGTIYPFKEGAEVMFGTSKLVVKDGVISLGLLDVGELKFDLNSNVFEGLTADALKNFTALRYESDNIQGEKGNTFISNVKAYSYEEIKNTVRPNTAIAVKFDGGYISDFDVPPQLIGGATMVPMRRIFNAFGFTNENIKYENKTITATKDGVTIVHVVGTSKVKINGVEQTIINPDSKKPVSPSVIVGGRTLVPVRLVAACTTEYTVTWDGTKKDVVIAKK